MMNRRDFMKIGVAGVGAFALNGASKASALEFYPRPSDRKWAVLYASWYGTSRDAALWISEGMGMIANVFDIREKPDLGGYDFLVLGSSIQWGKISPELQQYLEVNKGTLKGKIKGLYAVCGNLGKTPGPKQHENYIEKHLAVICEADKVPSKVFGGRMTSGMLTEQDSRALKEAGIKYNLDFMKNYDNLSRKECMEFGKSVMECVKKS
jgi:menaquinone-dependent protoporphyrinogen IX oxidase